MPSLTAGTSLGRVVVAASDCVGCPSGHSPVLAVVVGLLAVAAGVGAWSPLGRLAGATGRVAAGLAALAGVAAIVVGA